MQEGPGLTYIRSSLNLFILFLIQFASNYFSFYLALVLESLITFVRFHFMKRRVLFHISNKMLENITVFLYITTYYKIRKQAKWKT